MRDSGRAAVVFLVFSLALPAGFSAQERISPLEAAKYVGKSATVCGKVASTAYAIQVAGRPTFLNLERPYPNQLFTVVIWGSERSKFSPPPEKAYDGKKICVSGVVRVFRDEPPRIVVETPSQITIE
jgi:micrococcal nuclease